jgi:hypothetical protein
MNFMASGRSALIIVAGLWLCLAGPVSAQESDAGAANATSSDTTATESTADAPAVPNKPVKPHVKKPAAAQTHQSSKAASKPSGGKKTDDALASPDDASSIPAAVSNAKAQLGSGSSAADNALKRMSEQAEDTLKVVSPSDPAAPPSAASTANSVVAPDQLNDVDRSLSQDAAPAPTLSMMVPQTPTYSTSNVDSTWGRTSLIGKVFVALGGLLTLASAARMFIA